MARMISDFGEVLVVLVSCWFMLYVLRSNITLEKYLVRLDVIALLPPRGGFGTAPPLSAIIFPLIIEICDPVYQPGLV